MTDRLIGEKRPEMVVPLNLRLDEVTLREFKKMLDARKEERARNDPEAVPTDPA